jgi:N utilization substance protein B
MTAARKPANPLAARRHKARHYAMQALYQWHMAGAPLGEIEAEFRGDYDFGKVDGEYFHILLHEIPANVDGIEAAFEPYMVDRSLEELDPIERALLRIATYELMERIDVPYKVVINEAVNLAKKFGATDSHKFINGVLDQVAHQLRSVEAGAEART